MSLEKQVETLRQSRIWLGGIESDFEFEKNWKLHTAGTCEWILKDELFKSWTVEKVQVFLITGIPGKFILLFSFYVFCARAKLFFFGKELENLFFNHLLSTNLKNSIQKTLNHVVQSCIFSSKTAIPKPNPR